MANHVTDLHLPDRDSTDLHFLRRALDLARQGLGLASPNPHVGAVIVDPRDKIVGKGVYMYQELKHAEVLALTQAGEKARGGTLYINLEPHAHQGRTPPCTDALIAAGIRRVVVSMADPNPKVSGLGFAKLRAAGIEVEVGGLEEEARRLNEPFARYIRQGIPFVTLKSAMTLDGKIAPTPSSIADHPEGMPARGWITGEAARAHVHEQRHAADAIMVGVGTVLADDPLLTDRSRRPRRRRLLRVILDSQLRLPLESRLVRSSVKNEQGDSDVILFHSSSASPKISALESTGVRVEYIQPSQDGRPDLHPVLRRLAQLDITSLIIEGGSTLNGAALAAGIVDKIFFYYAPKIMGGAASIPFVRNLNLPLALDLQNLRCHHFEQDFAIEGYLRNPYAD